LPLAVAKRLDLAEKRLDLAEKRHALQVGGYSH